MKNHKPTISEALEYLSNAKSVKDWNARRAHIQKTMSIQEFNQKYAYQIDGGGLIVQTLAKNSTQKLKKFNTK